MSTSHLGVAPKLDNERTEDLVFHVVLFTLGVAGLAVLFRLPRALARFWRSSEWLMGHFFWHTSYQRSNAPRSFSEDNPSEVASAKEAKDLATEDSHTLYSYANRAGGRSDDDQDALGASYPPHIASCPRFLRPVVILHRIRLSPGFALSQALLMLFYFGTLAYAGLYRSNPFTDPVRTGWVAVAQLPILFALATKNSIPGMLLGFSYTKLNFLHRYLGRFVVLCANIHALGYIYKWSLQGTFAATASKPFAIWGLVALVAMDVLFFFSLGYLRTKHYNVMITTHIVGIALVIPGLWLHEPATIPWVAACVGLYGLDHVLRTVKTRVATAIIRPLSELNSTHIEIPHLNGGWRAGQHVRLRVLSLGVGWWGWVETHPFTIASVSGGHEGVVLIAKKTGGWTSKLYEMAKSSGYTEAGYGRNIKVMVEGPYGGPGHAIYASYSAAVFVVGGSGITFALSAIQDLIRKDLKGRSRVKVIELIWVVQDPAALHPLLPRFSSMIMESTYTPVHISVHYTRAPLGEKPVSPRQPGLTLSPGRPRIAKVLDAALSRAVSLGAGAKDSQRITGMLVGVCGPAALGDDVSKAVSSIDPARRDQVGGIEVHEEVFGL
ncbi:putative ferric reductase like transmembrane component [Lyophyllum shimeji]|uniref:ferric-chelate reductase (NADPH) n=1 Tax=Lyophyllum shimeji TaxID=47721 RepID=A0A9P3USC6_LYOSH|nr:putative ferric reductase like transmembrane component [Lyophyllum shimeji]